jgi:hypothetical protein
MYFSIFPTTDYSYYNKEQERLSKSVRDITKRVKFLEYVKTFKTNFDDYTIGDGERPDTLSDRLYDTPTYHWVFYLINDILNPYYSWPMTSEELNRHISEKYSGSSFFVPDIWKNKSSEVLYSKRYNVIYKPLESVTLSDINSGFFEEDINENVLFGFSTGSQVKVLIRGKVYTTTIKTVNENFYELELERKDWNPTNFNPKTSYLIYQSSNSAVNVCIKIPITRMLNERRYSVHNFSYNGQEIDPRKKFEDSLVGLEDPYSNFYDQNLNNTQYFLDVQSNSFADVYAIKGKDEEYMNPSFYVTNQDYELSINESKRTILVPRPETVRSVVTAMKTIFSQST